jgi:hypothetical protein
LLLFLNITIAVVLGAMRLGGMDDKVFQAIAHVYIGGLFVYGWVEHPAGIEYWSDYSVKQLTKRKKHFFWLAVSLTLLEVAAFLLFKFDVLTKQP